MMNPTNLTDVIFEVSKSLVDEMWDEIPIRLVGIRLDNLTLENNRQVSLFDDIKLENKNVELEKTLDELKDKFGNSIIRKASSSNHKINKKYL